MSDRVVSLDMWLAHRLRRLGDQAFCVANPSRQEAHAVKSSRPTAVPKHMQTTYDAVVALTDAFCGNHLTGEYAILRVP